MQTALRNILFANGGPGWLVVGVGVARNLRQLGAMLNANPSANCTQLGPYNASFDGVLSGSVVTALYTGTFNGQFFPITNLRILNASTASGLAISLFGQLDTAGVVQNAIISGGNITDASTGFNNGRVAPIVAYNAGMVKNCYSSATVLGCAGGSFVSGLVADTNGGTVQDCIIQANVSLSNDAFNTGMACVSAYLHGGGLMQRCYVTGGSLFCPTGTSNIPNLACFTPPCPTTGSWMAPLVSTCGQTNANYPGGTILDCYSTINVVGATNQNAANIVGGLVSNLIASRMERCYSTGNISGGPWVGGGIGKTQTSSGTPATSYVADCWSSGSVTGTFNKCGGFIGENGSGIIERCYAKGNVGAVGSVGGFAGYNNGGSITNCFAWGNAVSTGALAAGGFCGYNNTASTIAKCYSLGISSGTGYVGAFVGLDKNNAGETTNYWDTTTSGSTRGSGSTASPSNITGKTTAQMKAGTLTGFGAEYTWTSTSGYPILVGLTDPGAYVPVPVPALKMIVLTGSGNWTVPDGSDPNYPVCSAAGFTVECIGPGGNGADATTIAAGRGGGSAAYSRTPGLVYSALTVIPYAAPAGGSQLKTTFNTTIVVADFGTNATTAVTGQGGLTANGTGTVRSPGRAGGVSSGSGPGGAGAGAAGPQGAGVAAGSGVGNGTSGGGGGGGSAEVGGAAGAALATTGGAGGDSIDGIAGGVGSTDRTVDGGAGSLGSGGGGGFGDHTAASKGGAGGDGHDWRDTATGNFAGPAGGGGGGGGCSSTLPTGGNGGAGGLYGAGGGGGGRGPGTAGGTGGLGSAGVVVISYTPAS